MGSTTTHRYRYNYTHAAAADYDDDNDAAASAPLSPDVVANPWNTSLLWSSGVANNNDPTSNFYPINSWRNNTIPANLNTYPINYYFSASDSEQYLTFDFRGHGLAILDFPGPNRARYNVTIDNSSAIVDAFSFEDQLAKASGSQLPSSIWTSGTLSEGTHQVLIQNMNDTAELQFWGVVINPENYHAGKSFAPATSNIRLVTIAASVSAVVVSLLFITIGSILYYFKISLPRKRMQAQVAAEGSNLHLLGKAPTMSQQPMPPPSRPDLRLMMHYNSSQGDLGRAPSFATTHESHYWVRPESGPSTQQTLVSPVSTGSQLSLISPLRENGDVYATAASEHYTAPYALSRKLTSPVSFTDPFQDYPTLSPGGGSVLQRSTTLRRPLPIPPIATLEESPPPTTMLQEPRVRIELDAGSIHMSDVEESTNPVLPPPYAPRRMGQDFV